MPLLVLLDLERVWYVRAEKASAGRDLGTTRLDLWKEERNWRDQSSIRHRTFVYCGESLALHKFPLPFDELSAECFPSAIEHIAGVHGKPTEGPLRILIDIYKMSRGYMWAIYREATL